MLRTEAGLRDFQIRSLASPIQLGKSRSQATRTAIRAAARSDGIIPTYRLVDTCAAEFEAFTPYYYSTYGIEDEVRDNDRKKVMILGGGPNRIGQGIEFDYCCVHASFALRELGYETIMVNSNPETVSTDYDTSDKLYFEPLTLEDVLNIYERENVNDQVLGVIVQFGGQTPLNLAKGLEENGVRIIGTSPKNIELAEDRKLFAKLLDDLGLHQAPSGTATSLEEALAITARSATPASCAPASCSAAAPCRSSTATPNSPTTCAERRRGHATTAPCSSTASSKTPPRSMSIASATAKPPSSAPSWSTSKRPASTPATAPASSRPSASRPRCRTASATPPRSSPKPSTSAA
jgi:hypothetical protein